MVLTGKYASTRHSIEQRAGIAAWNEYTFPLNTSRVYPLHCDAMSSILAR